MLKRKKLNKRKIDKGNPVRQLTCRVCGLEMGDVYGKLLNCWGWLVTSMRDAGGFQVNRHRLGVNCLHQLPHASGLFLVYYPNLVMLGNREIQERYLIGIP